MKYIILSCLISILLSCSKEQKIKLILKEEKSTLQLARFPEYVSNSKVDSFWTKRQYSYAKVYLYQGRNQKDSILISNQLHSTVVDKKGLLLSPSDSEKIVFQILNGKSTLDSSGPADCFQPHHGIVFYDQKNTPFGHVSVCFLCNDMKVFPSGNKFTLDSLEGILIKNKIPVFKDEEESQTYFQSIK